MTEKFSRRKFLIGGASFAITLLGADKLIEFIDNLETQNANLAFQNARLSTQQAAGKSQLSALQTQQAAEFQQATEIARKDQIIAINDKKLSQNLTNLSVQATQDAELTRQNLWNMLPYRVMATSEALRNDPQALQEILNSFPSVVITNSFKIGFLKSIINSAIKGAYNGVYGGSAGLIEYDRNTRKGLVVTAGHVLSDPRPVDAIALTTINDDLGFFLPFTNDSKIIHPAKDIGLIKADFAQDQQGKTPTPETNLHVPVSENWVPRPGQKLYSISFSSATEEGDGIWYTPSIFEVSQETPPTADLVVSTAVVFKGSSGAPVFDELGQLIGIINSGSPLGTGIVPVGTAIKELKNQAGLT